MGNRSARYVNMALGAWLFISAFAWQHTNLQFTNTWIMGIVAIVAAGAALGTPAMRFVNSAVGVWLVVSAFALSPKTAGTTINNALVGIAMFFTSLIGERPPRRAIERTA